MAQKIRININDRPAASFNSAAAAIEALHGINADASAANFTSAEMIEIATAPGEPRATIVIRAYLENVRGSEVASYTSAVTKNRRTFRRGPYTSASEAYAAAVKYAATH